MIIDVTGTPVISAMFVSHLFAKVVPLVSVKISLRHDSFFERNVETVSLHERFHVASLSPP